MKLITILSTSCPAGVFTKVRAKILPISIMTLVYGTILGTILLQCFFISACKENDHFHTAYGWRDENVPDQRLQVQVLWKPRGLPLEWRTNKINSMTHLYLYNTTLCEPTERRPTGESSLAICRCLPGV